MAPPGVIVRRIIYVMQHTGSPAGGPGGLEPRTLPPMDVKRLEGLWFDDLVTGTRIESPRRTVTEADIVAFAGLSPKKFATMEPDIRALVKRLLAGYAEARREPSGLDCFEHPELLRRVPYASCM